ncbi:MAG: tRNA (guanosine(37)-N1)-methyltransferase TrmD [Spirochaetota bacterium]
MAVKFKILTLFKEAFDSYLNSSIIKRGIEAGEIEVELIDFRDYAKNKHKKVDDNPYGGGPGMLLMLQPLYDAITDIKEENDLIIFLSPNGKLLNQKRVIEYSKYDSFILICGKYEGFDARIFKFFEHEKVSIGDYILTGGELPAMVILDAVSRYKDILHNKSSVDEESFSNNGLLEYNQYTRPREFKGESVPEVLLNGNHAEIEKFRKKSSIINTLKNRPELIENNKQRLSEEEIDLIKNIKKEYNINNDSSSNIRI